jgi:predicted ester cyclase
MSSPTTTPSANRQALERALRHFADPATHDLYFDLYDPSIVLHGYQGVEPGIESVKQFYRAAIWGAFPDAKVQILDTIEDQTGSLLTCRFLLTGTHLGPFLGMPATGKPFEMNGMSILRFNAEAKCVERWSVADFLAVLMQIGAFPPPAGASA